METQTAKPQFGGLEDHFLFPQVLVVGYMNFHVNLFFVKAKLDLGAWCCIYKSNFHLSQISDQDCEGLKCFMLEIHEVRSKADSNIFRVKWIAQAFSGTSGVLRKRPKTNVNS